ncbi:MAG: protein-export chaperone SecB [Eubacterium sp.]
MGDLYFKGYKVNEINFVNRITKNGKLEMHNKLNYNVNYKEDTYECFGTCVLEIEDASNEFDLKVSLTGVFSYAPGADRKKMHVETYNELFPYLRSIITNITANAGMPPIIIPKTEIDEDAIDVRNRAQ